MTSNSELHSKLSVKFKKENKDIFRHAGSQILTPTHPYIRQQMEDMLYQTNKQAEEEEESNQETGARLSHTAGLESDQPNRGWRTQGTQEPSVCRRQ